MRDKALRYFIVEQNDVSCHDVILQQRIRQPTLNWRERLTMHQAVRNRIGRHQLGGLDDRASSGYRTMDTQSPLSKIVGQKNGEEEFAGDRFFCRLQIRSSRNRERAKGRGCIDIGSVEPTH